MEAVEEPAARTTVTTAIATAGARGDLRIEKREGEGIET